MTELFDAVVVGAGPAGIATALALHHVGAKVALAGPPPPDTAPARPETRTAALLTSSVDFLKRLGVWERLEPDAAPLTAIRIVDASRSLLRSPDIAFESRELGLACFGFNIANAALNRVLYERARAVLPHLATATVDAVKPGADRAMLTLCNGERLACRLVAGSDGRRSICRQAAKIETRDVRYEQSAIASSFRHSLPHQGVATELHREGGSVTSVPTPDQHTSSLVWVTSAQEAEALMALDEASFAARLQERFDETLGVISDVGPRASFPVAGLTAKQMRPIARPWWAKQPTSWRRSGLKGSISACVMRLPWQTAWRMPSAMAATRAALPSSPSTSGPASWMCCRARSASICWAARCSRSCCRFSWPAARF
jgi:2-octaprenyl-6-methoxyphenol hydroxylase